jgi:aspartate racemase
METRLEYSTDLFEPATARQILRHYRNVLESVAANADQLVTELPLLSAGERDRILRQWNRTGIAYPRQDPIHRLFETQALQRAGEAAVVCATDKLNYSELNARANQLARHLCALGVSPETIVALAMGRSIEMIIAMLAVLKAGAAYLPVDPEYPKDRLEFMLRHADVRVLVTTSEWARMLSVTEVRRVLVDEDWNVIARHPDDNLSGETSAESLAYVMYTSGSEGRPKAVAIPHRGVTRLVCSANYGDLGPDEVFLNLSSPSFDLTTLEIWGPLLNGGRVAVFRSADVHARELGSALREHEVTALWLTSSLFNAIVDEEPRSLLPVRQLFIGGEALSVAHVRRAVAVLPTTELINGYGPTESTTFATTYRIPKRLPDRLPSIPIGFPISNTYVHVLDAHSQLVPLGVPGELCIGGDGLARAYLNDPERTRERFIPDPFSAEPGARLYRSGDLVRRLRDGDLEFLGRIDDQVKIRGFRVEPAEVEAAISSNSAVRSAAVIARDDSAGSRDLIAYVVRENGTENGGARDNQRLDGGMLSAYLAERLPKYMLPSAYVFLPELPRTKNGKLDRRRLPQPAPQVAAESYAEPRTGLELRLAQIFEGVLGVRPIGVHDDFFRLGGHSLMALRLMSQIEKVVGESLPLNVLFEAPTVEKLACVIRKRSVESKWDSLVPIRLAGSRPPLFCIHGIGGGVLSYAELARELPPDLPLYGLQARGFAQGEEPHTTVEDMAADYVKQIRSIQPTGPYFLAGFSFGGLIAFEMARQLYAAEERVALLALLDTAAIGVSKRLPFLAHCRAYIGVQIRRLRLHGGNLLALNLREKQQYVRGPVRTIRRKVHNRLWQLRYKLYQNLAQPLPKELQNVTQAAYLAQKQYTPGVYRGKAVLFRAEQCSPLFTADPTLGWGGVITGGVDVRVVPGNHLTIGVGENAAALARELESALQSL